MAVGADAATSAVIVVGEKRDAAYVAQVLARSPGATLVSSDAVAERHARGIAASGRGRGAASRVGTVALRDGMAAKLLSAHSYSPRGQG